MGKKKKSDLLLWLFSLILIVSVGLFLVTSQTSLPPLDVSGEWSGGAFKITFTGISEIIVAIGSAIGIILRLKK